jgi:hypothetical protein
MARGRWKCSGRVGAAGGKCLNIQEGRGGRRFRAARPSFSFAIFVWGTGSFARAGAGRRRVLVLPQSRSRRLCYTTPSLMWEKSGGAEELGCTRSVGLIAGPVKAIPHSVVVVVQPFEHFQPTVREAIYFLILVIL